MFYVFEQLAIFLYSWSFSVDMLLYLFLAYALK